MPNQSQGLDILSVISLGHTCQQPLMCSASELLNGYEPHDHIYSAVMTGEHATLMTVVYGGVPGVRGLGGYREGTIPGTVLRPDLTLI